MPRPAGTSSTSGACPVPASGSRSPTSKPLTFCTAGRAGTNCGIIIVVVPSGAARSSASVAMAVLAPGRFSTTTVTPRRSARPGA